MGIQLMLCIHNWKDLTWCRPSDESRYAHIDVLFSTTIEWDLIATVAGIEMSVRKDR